MSEAKKLNDSSVTPVTSVASNEYFIITDANGKTKKILLANLKTALLGGMDFNAMYEGVFIMTHRKSDNYPIAYRPEQWTAQQNAGEVADGVLLIEGGKQLVIAPTECDSSGLLWASANVSGGGYTTSDRVNSAQDFAGKANTAAQILHAECQGVAYAPGFCAAYSRTNANGYGLTAGKWWLPSLGELFMMFANMKKINYALSLINGATQLAETAYWSSTETSAAYAWFLNFSNGYQGTGSGKSANRYRVRPVSAFIS